MKKTYLVLALLAVGAQAGLAQERKSSRDFSWEGKVTPGHWLYVRNLNGAIRVERGSGSQTTVTAEKRWRRGDPDEVRIVTTKVGPGDDDVLICAIWGETTTCDEGGYHRQERRREWNDRNDVSVEFVVRVGDGVKLDLNTVNGGLNIDGATAAVEARTVNGSIVARSTGGPVVASTVNGSIEAHMATLGDKDLEFETVNGSIEVYVPDGLDAELDMRTVNGGVTSDFPLMVSGKINARHIHATIGKGGRRLEFRTVNGGVKLFRS
ncbi:MAG: DUF4097 family beta strand repeat-containing protein [Gemmatimonadaceae bacterium]